MFCACTCSVLSGSLKLDRDYSEQRKVVVKVPMVHQLVSWTPWVTRVVGDYKGTGEGQVGVAVFVHRNPALRSP